MTLSERLAENVRACFAGIWVQSCEHEDALLEIARLCHGEKWKLATWDIDQGLQLSGQSGNGISETTGADPLAAVRALGSMGTDDNPSLLVLVNFHRFLNSAEIVQAVARQINHGKNGRTFIVVLSPIVEIPTELEKQFVVLEHDLPGRDQLEELARSIATEEGELPDGDALETVLDAAAGLTRYEAEGAFSLSLVRHGAVEPEALWELKSGMLKKSGLLSLHRGGETFADLGGLTALKSFCVGAMRQQGHQDPLRRPRGVMLLSPPGCGKSQFAKSLGNETGRPTLILDVGSLMGSLVGSTESNIRKALQIVDAMAPCVCLIDEVEKALSGVASSGQTDSGVSARLFGTLLTWMNDHTSDVFLACTCNDISKLPPEFSRAERFDGVFFVDLPGTRERRQIWSIYIAMFDLAPKQQKPIDADWTGAEIKSCCRLAALLDVPLVEAAQNVVPVARTAHESVEKLRSWASGRCLSADKTGLYTRKEQAATTKPRRKVHRADPSNN